MKRSILLTYFIFSISLFSYGEVVTFNYLLKNLENNYKLKDNYENSELVFGLKKSINNIAYFPQLNLIAQGTFQSDVTKILINIPFANIPSLSKDQYKIALEINQMIYDASITEIKNNRDYMLSKMDAIQSRLGLSTQKELLNRLLYFFLINNKTKEQLSEQRRVLVEKQSDIEKMIESGIATSTDLNLLIAEIYKIEQQIDALEVTCNSLITNIELLTGVELKNKSIEYDEEDIETTPVITRYELDLLERKASLNEMNAEIALKSRLPQIFAFGQFGYGKPALNMLDNDFNSYYLVGVKVVFNIFDWGKSADEKSIAEINNKSLKNEREYFLQNLTIQMNDILSSIDKVGKWIEKDYKIITLREEILNSTYTKLINGTAKMTDYLADLNQKTQALLDLEKHKIEKKYYIQSYKLSAGVK